MQRGRIDRRQFLAGAGSVIAAGLAASTFGATIATAAPIGAGIFVPLPAQRRIADTRNAQLYPFERLTDRRIRVAIKGVPGVPANAVAAVLTVTVVNRSTYNFVTVYPAGTALPEASNLNLTVRDEVAANLVTVQLGADGAVDLDAIDLCDLVVDVAGLYVPSAAGSVKAGRFVAPPGQESRTTERGFMSPTLRSTLVTATTSDGSAGQGVRSPSASATRDRHRTRGSGGDLRGVSPGRA